jgi:hypothetical protein
MISPASTLPIRQGIQGERGFNGINTINGTNGLPDPPGITTINGTNIYRINGDHTLTTSNLSDVRVSVATCNQGDIGVEGEYVLITIFPNIGPNMRNLN